MHNIKLKHLVFLLAIVTTCTAGAFGYGELSKQSHNNEKVIDRHEVDIRANTLMNMKQTIILDSVTEKLKKM